MSTPSSGGKNRIAFSGPFIPDGDLDELLPRTSIDHLLTEEERRKAEEERREFEAVGRAMDWNLNRESLYPAVYELASEKIASGVSLDVIREEMRLLAEGSDDEFASIIREAYEDVLAGRPPRYTSEP